MFHSLLHNYVLKEAYLQPKRKIWPQRRIGLTKSILILQWKQVYFSIPSDHWKWSNPTIPPNRWVRIIFANFKETTYVCQNILLWHKYKYFLQYIHISLKLQCKLNELVVTSLQYLCVKETDREWEHLARTLSLLFSSMHMQFYSSTHTYMYTYSGTCTSEGLRFIYKRVEGIVQLSTFYVLTNVEGYPLSSALDFCSRCWHFVIIWEQVLSDTLGKLMK